MLASAVPSRALRLQACGHTHPGLVMPSNEDAFAIRDDLGLCIVADGLGGPCGQLASRMLLDSIVEFFDDPHTTLPVLEQPPAHPALWVLVAGIVRANVQIWTAAQTDPAKQGMGSTVSAVITAGAQVGIAHVGQSRVYRLRRGQMEQLTQDHTLVAEWLRNGTLQPDDVSVSELAHVLTRAVGVNEQLQVMTRLEDVMENDTLLICSDGLTSLLTDHEIAAILRSSVEPARAVRRLVDHALGRGAPDNVTCVVLHWSR